MAALEANGYDVVPIGITREGRWLAGEDPMAQLVAASPMFHLADGEQSAIPSSAHAIVPVVGPEAILPRDSLTGIDLFFPVLHGPMGEDGTIQGLFEMAGVPYVGSGVLGSAVGMDKAMTKHILTQVGVSQIPWLLVNRGDWQTRADEIERGAMGQLGLPLFVKPANMGSSVGITKAHTADELHTAIQEAANFDRRIIVERSVSGRELEMAVLGNDRPIVSGIGEIRPKAEFYDYASKYLDDSADLIIPADVHPAIVRTMEQMAIASFRALDLAGLARVDFFLEHGTDTVYVNEVNTLPGFTSISMYPSLWAEAGIAIDELVRRLVELALERHAGKRPR